MIAPSNSLFGMAAASDRREPTQKAGAVCVVVLKDGMNPADRRVHHIHVGNDGVSVHDAALRALAAEPSLNPSRYCGAIDGSRAVEVGSTEVLHAGQSLVLAPRVAGGETLLMIGIALVTAAASAAMAARVRIPSASDTTTPDSQRFYFNRVSTQIEAGESIPVVLGTVQRMGLKVYQVQAIEASDGSGDDRIRMLMTAGHGGPEGIGGFGSLTSDQNNVSAADVTGIYYNDDQPVSTLKNCRLWARMGTADQAVIPGFTDVILNQEVGVGGSAIVNTTMAENTGGSPGGEEVTITTLNAVDAVRVRVRFSNGLYETGAATQIQARRCQWRVRTRNYDDPMSPGSWTSWTVVTVDRAQSSRFYSALRLDNLYGDGPHVTQVQVERVTVDATLDTQIDAMAWETLVNITYDPDQAYAGHAMLAMELTASEQVSDVPQVTADVAGVKCRVWDGSGDITDPGTSAAMRATTSNVAAVLAELLTNTVWGAGEADSRVWKDSLAALWLRCDEAVALRSGSGTRPRFAVNIVLNTREPAIDAVRRNADIAWAGAAKVGHEWLFVCDSVQANPVESFGDEAIALGADGSAQAVIEYENTKGVYGTRPNQWVAQFANEDEGGRTDTLCYPVDGTLWLAEDWPDGQEVARQETLRLDGQTNPEQVIDYLVYVAKRERDLDHTVAFETTRPIVAVQPGDRFDLAWSMPGWGLASGRVANGCTTESVLLDMDVTLEDGEEYTIKVTHLDGTEESRTIASTAGTYPAGTAVNVSPAFSDSPEAFCPYQLGATGEERKPFRCTALEPVSAEGLRWRVSGKAYDAEVYDRDLAVATLDPYSSLVSIFRTPGPVQTISVRLVMDGTRARAELSWSQRPEDAAITGSYRVFWRPGGTTTWVRQSVSSNTNRSAVFDVDEESSYEFIAVAVSHAGYALSPIDPRHPIASLNMRFGGGSGGVLPPPATGALDFDADAGTYTLSWDAVEGAVEYQVLTGGDSTSLPNDGAEDCLVLTRTAALSVTGLVLAAGETHRFYVRSVSASGRLSWSCLLVEEATAGTPTGKSIKHTQTFDLSTDGTLSNLAWNGTTGRLELVDPTLPGTWTSQTIDTGTGTDSRLALRPGTANDWSSSDDADTSDIEDLVFAVPSIEADQFGVVDGGTGESGMLMPPYSSVQSGGVDIGDGAQSWGVEVRTRNGGAWSSWAALAHCAGHSATFEEYELRWTLARGAAPYRPGLRTMIAVVTD